MSPPGDALSLSAQEARWLALDAQRLSRARRASRSGATAAELEATVRALGAVQLDAVNIVERSHFLVFFSRLGAFDRRLVNQLSGPGGPLWEYWGHAASLLPVEDEPLFRWRYEIGGTYVPGPKVRARREAWEQTSAGYLDAVLQEVRQRGPLSARDLVDPRPRQGEWWARRSGGRQALAWLHGRGKLATWRSPSFESVYDLPERVFPSEVMARPTPGALAAQRDLLFRAAEASGVGTAADLTGYYMLPTTAKAQVAELVREGRLTPARVEGWDELAYVPAGRLPRRPTRATATLLSPFDSLIWDRQRARRLFGFDYRIEIYVPAPRRIHGYYVLPLLLGDRLVARLDLKADRRAGVLRVLGAHVEAGADLDQVATATRQELTTMAQWLGLEETSVNLKGDLAPALAG